MVNKRKPQDSHLGVFTIPETHLMTQLFTIHYLPPGNTLQGKLLLGEIVSETAEEFNKKTKPNPCKTLRFGPVGLYDQRIDFVYYIIINVYLFQQKNRPLIAARKWVYPFG